VHPVSSQIMSKWIYNHQNLHINPGEYRISVKNASMLDFFEITPKLCDSLMYCRNVKVINNKDNPKVKTNHYHYDFEFTFDEIKNSDFVKLVFYVEHFIPRRIGVPLDKPQDVEFQLELLHFGDPCYKNQNSCGKDGFCYSDPLESIPNELVCDCPSGITGDRCQIVDYCIKKVIEKFSESNFLINLTTNSYPFYHRLELIHLEKRSVKYLVMKRRMANVNLKKKILNVSVLKVTK